MWETTFAGSKQTLLTMIDNGTRWVEAVVLKDKTADSVASAFLKSWVCRFGVPSSVICDRGSAFLSEVFLGLTARLGIKVLPSSAYHPQGNALIERFHRSLKYGIVCLGMTSAVRLEFDEMVQLTLFAYRASIHLPLRETPAYMTYGVDLRPTADFDWRLLRSRPEKERFKLLQAVRYHVMARAFAKLRAAEDARLNTQRPLFILSDLVVVELHPLDIEKVILRDSVGRKLVPKWSIPHRIVHVFPGQQKATALNLVTFEKREVHLSQVRFLNPPLTPKQQVDWERILLKEMPFLDVPEEMQRKLKRFWDAVYVGLGQQTVIDRKRVQQRPAGSEREYEVPALF